MSELYSPWTDHKDNTVSDSSIVAWRNYRNGPQRIQQFLPLLSCLATVVNKRFHCWLLTYSVHVTILSVSADCIASNGTDWDGDSRRIIEVLSWNLPGGTGRSHGKPQSRYTVSRPRFETSPFILDSDCSRTRCVTSLIQYLQYTDV
jgi:hypothetical protein